MGFGILGFGLAWLGCGNIQTIICFLFLRGNVKPKLDSAKKDNILTCFICMRKRLYTFELADLSEENDKILLNYPILCLEHLINMFQHISRLYNAMYYSFV